MNANDKDLSYPLGTTEIRTLALVTNPHAGHGASQIASARASRVFAVSTSSLSKVLTPTTPASSFVRSSPTAESMPWQFAVATA